VLAQKIDGMLYQRTAISKKPKTLNAKELRALREKNVISPNLVFQDPYLLDFLGLRDTYSEIDEAAPLERTVIDPTWRATPATLEDPTTILDPVDPTSSLAWPAPPPGVGCVVRGAIVAKLREDDRRWFPFDAILLATRGSHSYVAVETMNARVEGWVATSDLTGHRGASDRSGNDGRGRATRRRLPRHRFPLGTRRSDGGGRVLASRGRTIGRVE
jgi:hypothetical protein